MVVRLLIRIPKKTTTRKRSSRTSTRKNTVDVVQFFLNYSFSSGAPIASVLASEKQHFPSSSIQTQIFYFVVLCLVCLFILLLRLFSLSFASLSFFSLTADI